MNKLDLTNTADRILPKILRAQAEQAGDTEFLVTETQRITFAKADSITNSLAAGLQELGVQRGDRVALYMSNRPEVVLLALAVNKLGAIWTPINTDYKGQWLLHALEGSRAKVLVTEEQFQQRILEVHGELDNCELVVFSDSGNDVAAGAHAYAKLADSAPVELSYEGMDYGDTCAILWTSGTTGKSKGVLQSHNCWIRAITSGASPLYDSQEGDIIYNVLPLFNSGAWVTSVFRALIEGIPCVLEQKFSVSQFWDRVNMFGATQTIALGAMAMFLLSAPTRPNDADTTLRVAQLVPLPAEQWPIFEKRFGVRLVRSGMGQSECMMVTSSVGAPDNAQVHSIGVPFPDTEIKLVDDEGNEVTPGEPGELYIRELEPHILFSGYFDNPEATAEAYSDDWFKTEDIVRQDPETGAYFYVDRKKDAVRFAGRNLSTLEVESVVRSHPGVQDVAAFGIPSEVVESEQELKLNIVLRNGEQLSHEDICSYINDNAPFYFVPRYMEFVDSLPYTPTNKVQKFKLREQGVSESCWDLKNSDYQVRR